MGSQVAMMLLVTSVFVTPQIVVARPAPLASSIATIQMDTGQRSNPSGVASVVFRQRLDIAPEAPWIRLFFSSATLTGGSWVKVTSLLDGEFQILDARTLEEWNLSTAFFNGSSLEVELVAAPHTTGNRLAIERVLVGRSKVESTGLGVEQPEGICGPDDNRSPFDDAAVARLLTGDINDTTVAFGRVGCTAFLIDRPQSGSERLFLSAGHCFNAPHTVVQFNVPSSMTNCGLRHPPVKKQFVVNQQSVRRQAGGPGNDWAVFVCFPNPNTGKTAYEEQGTTRILASTIPGGTPALREVGYGVDANDGAAGGGNAACAPCNTAGTTGSRNQMGQIAFGTLVGLDGTKLQYQVDDCGGNSGSPVMLNDNVQVIGIDAWSGCELALGFNEATAITHPGLQAAIATVPGTSDASMVLLVFVLLTAGSWAIVIRRRVWESVKQRSS